MYVRNDSSNILLYPSSGSDAIASNLLCMHGILVYNLPLYAKKAAENRIGSRWSNFV